jgi:chromosome segregation ATPase
MSEKSRRPASQAKGSNRADPGDDDESFSCRFAKVASDFGSLLQDAGGMRSVINLIIERDTLRETVQQKGEEIERLRSQAAEAQQRHGENVSSLEKEKLEIKPAIDIMMSEIGTRYEKWHEAMNRYESQSTELSRLRSDFNHTKRQVDQLSTENQVLRGETKRLEGEVKEKEDSNEKLFSRLQRRDLKLKETVGDLAKCRSVLGELQDNLGIIPLDKDQV